ncbi:hypothetical protein ASZ90_010328 [hydrocarbon metagenome]|uniref:Uncharacterized protein n=1 Tax=hydrocarbon metagenome TaxID=938273 RepID=A0A0W8FGB7_9ZZZZ
MPAKIPRRVPATISLINAAQEKSRILLGAVTANIKLMEMH